ncbi:uncharacterized protein [Dermacentor andersoni]|uniref:uncharacterized protein n=1 Tax=Dermacentor andersoni TaxID=34620 RepID=UPI0024178442|nr:uncharacterized protein LOC129384115 isoform X2 [Dermacentor andersoni]
MPLQSAVSLFVLLVVDTQEKASQVLGPPKNFLRQAKVVGKEAYTQGYKCVFPIREWTSGLGGELKSQKEARRLQVDLFPVMGLNKELGADWSLQRIYECMKGTEMDACVSDQMALQTTLL